MSTTISCVVTSSDNGAWLKQAIESVLAQSRPPDEIVIADDASTDGSQDLIRSLAAEHATIRPILGETNRGVAASRDDAVRSAEGALITTLDGDDYYYPAKIERELAALETANGPAVAYSDVDFVDSGGAPLTQARFTAAGAATGDALIRYLLFRTGPTPRGLLMPKALFVSAGGYRPELEGFEDFDLELRLARDASGWHRVPEPGMACRRHDRGLSGLDGLGLAEHEIRVIFLNRDWLEVRFGVDAIRIAIARRVGGGEDDPSPAVIGSGRSSSDLIAASIAAYQKQSFAEAAALLKEAIAVDPEASCHAVTLAHSLLLTAPWGEVNACLPSNTNHLITSGWLNSVFAGEPINKAGRPIPWYTYPAIDFIERTIGDDLRVFEWGAGNSTRWWAKRARRVVSVEHNPQWIAKIENTLPAHVQLKHRGAANGYAAELATEAAGSFNVVVIDGEARNDCARLAAEYADPAGIIVFDNSDRRSFRDGVAHLSACGWKRLDFYGLVPCYLYRNCTSIFFKDEALLARASLPSDVVTCVGPTCSQAIGQ